VAPRRLGWATTIAVAVVAALVAVPVLPAAARARTAAPARPPAPRTAVTPTPAPAMPCPVARVKRTPIPSPVPRRDAATPVLGGERLATRGLTLPDGAPRPPKVISATSWVVADLDTGEVLGACGPHEYGAPASVQKLLLAATVMPHLDPDRVVKVTAGDMRFEPGSSAVGLLRGGRYSVRLLWLGLLLNSGNDAANVLARLGGGPRGVPATLEAMNTEARRLGAWDTHADTPSGLDGPTQRTSAYDLALIARACFARPDFRGYVATRRAKVPAQPPRDKHGFQIQNDNRLLYEYPGALGGKNGFTDIARHTFVGAAERGGRRLVVTMLGAEHRPVRTWRQGAALLDWGFAVRPGLSVGRLVRPGDAELRAVPPATAPAGDRPAVVAAVTAPSGVARTGVVVTALALGAGALSLLLLRRRRSRSDA
jgi:serine-type D-Ala-D-Ala carboxypeptidase (penicillin-binding protein 5/6)